MKPSRIELEAFLNQHNRKEVAEHYGITQRTLRRWLKEYDLKNGQGPGKLDSEKAKRIRVLYASEQHTQQELAEMFDVTQSMIARIINNEAYSNNLFFGGSADVSHNIRH